MLPAMKRRIDAVDRAEMLDARKKRTGTRDVE